MKKSLGFRPPHWSLHLLPPGNTDTLCSVAAGPVAYSSLIILDFGRKRLDHLAHQAKHSQTETTDQIHIQHPFGWCSEAVQIIEQMPAGKTPILIFDLLAPFYDETIEISVRKLCLMHAIFHLKRLSRGARLAVIVPSPPPSYQAYCLLGRLVASASPVVPHRTCPSDIRDLKLF